MPFEDIFKDLIDEAPEVEEGGGYELPAEAPTFKEASASMLEPPPPKPAAPPAATAVKKPKVRPPQAPEDDEFNDLFGGFIAEAPESKEPSLAEATVGLTGLEERGVKAPKPSTMDMTEDEEKEEITEAEELYSPDVMGFGARVSRLKMPKYLEKPGIVEPPKIGEKPIKTELALETKRKRDLRRKLVPKKAAPSLAEATTGLTDITKDEPSYEMTLEKEAPEIKERTYWAKVAESFNRGETESAYMAMVDLEMEGLLEEGTEAKLRREYDIMVRSDPLKARTLLGRGLIEAARMAPDMIKGVAKGGVMGVSAGLFTLALTRNPAWAMEAVKIGGAMGTADYWRRQGRAEMYKEQVAAGIPEGVARISANIGSVPYALVEQAQIARLIPKRVAAKMYTAVLRGIVDQGLQMAENFGVQVFQEGVQKAISTASQELSEYGAGLKDPKARNMFKSYARVLDESALEMKNVAPAMLFMVAPGAATGVGQVAADASDAKRVQVGMNAMIDLASAVAGKKQELGNLESAENQAALKEEVVKKLNELSKSLNIKPDQVDGVADEIVQNNIDTAAEEADRAIDEAVGAAVEEETDPEQLQVRIDILNRRLEEGILPDAEAADIKRRIQEAEGQLEALRAPVEEEAIPEPAPTPEPAAEVAEKPVEKAPELPPEPKKLPKRSDLTTEEFDALPKEIRKSVFEQNEVTGRPGQGAHNRQLRERTENYTKDTYVAFGDVNGFKEANDIVLGPGRTDELNGKMFDINDKHLGNDKNANVHGDEHAGFGDSPEGLQKSLSAAAVEIADKLAITMPDGHIFRPSMTWVIAKVRNPKQVGELNPKKFGKDEIGFDESVGKIEPVRAANIAENEILQRGGAAKYAKAIPGRKVEAAVGKRAEKPEAPGRGPAPAVGEKAPEVAPPAPAPAEAPAPAPPPARKKRAKAAPAPVPATLAESKKAVSIAHKALTTATDESLQEAFKQSNIVVSRTDDAAARKQGQDIKKELWTRGYDFVGGKFVRKEKPGVRARAAEMAEEKKPIEGVRTGQQWREALGDLDPRQLIEQGVLDWMPEKFVKKYKSSISREVAFVNEFFKVDKAREYYDPRKRAIIDKRTKKRSRLGWDDWVQQDKPGQDANVLFDKISKEAQEAYIGKKRPTKVQKKAEAEDVLEKAREEAAEEAEYEAYVAQEMDKHAEELRAKDAAAAKAAEIPFSRRLRELVSKKEPGRDLMSDVVALADFKDALGADVGRELKAGEVSIVQPTGKHKEAIKALQSILPKWNIKVVRLSAALDKESNMDGFTHNGRIYLNEKTEAPTWWVMWHEAMHLAERENPSIFNFFMDQFEEGLTPDGRLAVRRRAVAESIRKRSVGLTEEEVNAEYDKLTPQQQRIGLREVAADTLADHSTDKSFWQEIYMRAPEFVKELFRTLVEAYNKLIGTIRKRFQGATQDRWFLDIVETRDTMVQLVLNLNRLEIRKIREAEIAKKLGDDIDSLEAKLRRERVPKPIYEHRKFPGTAGRGLGLVSRRFEQAKKLPYHSDMLFSRRAPADMNPATMGREEFINWSDHRKAVTAAYYNEKGELIASSRKTPAPQLYLAPGQWMIDDGHKGPHGHDIAQLRELDPNELVPTENLVDQNIEGRGWDADRYAEWWNQGLTPPPINVVETDTGKLQVTNGHRRLNAAKQVKQPVLAWVWPMMDDPQGRRYGGAPDAPVIRVGLTYEGAQEGRYKPPESVLAPAKEVEQLALFSRRPDIPKVTIPPPARPEMREFKTPEAFMEAQNRYSREFAEYARKVPDTAVFNDDDRRYILLTRNIGPHAPEAPWRITGFDKGPGDQHIPAWHGEYSTKEKALAMVPRDYEYDNQTVFSRRPEELDQIMMPGTEESETAREIERVKREKAEKERAEDRGVEGLPLFDKNVQDEMRTEQMRLFSRRQVFYSPTYRTVEAIQQEKGVTPQVQSMIRKGLFKKAEVEWLGLEEWLRENPAATKSEVLDFLRQAQVEIEESAKGFVPQAMKEARKKYREAIKADRPKEELDRLSAEVEKAQKGYAEITKYAQYTIPGGENYREVLLTLPPPRPPQEISYNDVRGFIEGGGIVEVRQRGKFLKNIMDIAGYDTVKNSPNIKYYKYYVPAERPYKTSHWTEPNVFAHARMDDRTGPNGEKILFINEIQSDWATEARKKGVGEKYVESDLKVLTKKEAPTYNMERFWFIEAPQFMGDSWGKQLFKISKKTYPTIKSAVDHIIKDKTKREGVPDQPFLKNWHEVVLKRVLRIAAEEGYDGVAWATGEQVADLYDLSKQVESIKWTTLDNDVAITLGGLVGVSDQPLEIFVEKDTGKVVTLDVGAPNQWMGKHLSDVIGKEPAEKILAKNEGILKGPDLKVGGIWAKNLYDRMIPQFFNKYGKKWGARVRQTIWPMTDKRYTDETGVTHQPYLPVTRDMSGSILEQGQPMFSRKPFMFDPDPEEERRRAQFLDAEIRKLRGKLVSMERENLQSLAEIKLEIANATADRIEIVKNLIYDYGRKIKLYKEPYNRIDTMLKNAKTVRDLHKAVEYMTNEMARRQHKALLNYTKDLIKTERTRIRKISGTRQSTVVLETNRRIMKYLDAITAMPKGREEMLRNKLEQFERDPDKQMSPDEQREIANLFRVNINEMNNEELAKIARDIKTLKRHGRLMKELKTAERRMKLEGMAKRSIIDITTESDKPDFVILAEKQQRRHNVMRNIKNMAKKFGWSQIRPERIIEWFTNWKPSVFKKAVFNPVLQAEKEKYRRMFLAKERFKKFYKDVDIPKAVKQTFMELDYEYEDIHGYRRTTKVPLTLSNMMFIFANSKNPGNLSHLIGTGIHEEVIMEVIEKLPKEYAELVNRQIEYYDTDQYQRMNEVYSDVNEIDMPKENNYFPIKHLKTHRAENSLMVDMMARYSSKLATTQKGFTKSRIQSKAAFRQMDYFQTVFQNSQEVEHYLAYEKPIRDIRFFLANKELRKAMETKSEEATRQVHDWLRAVAYGRVRGSEQIIDRISDYLRRNYVSSVLGLNLITIMKQPASFSQGLNMVDKGEAVKSAVRFLKNPARFIRSVQARSAMMEARPKQYEREIAEMAEEASVRSALGTRRAFEKFKEMSMQGIRFADMTTTSILWDSKFNEFVNKGESIEAAEAAADQVIRKTQPMGGLIHLPAMHRGGGLARAFTMFTNQLNQNLNLHFEMAQTWGMTPTSKNIQRIFWYSIMPGIIIYMASTGWDPRNLWRDPEGVAKAFISNIFGGVAFANQLIEIAVDKLGGFVKEWRGGRARRPFRKGFVPTSLEAVEDIYTFIADPDVRDLLEALTKLTGTPYAQVRRTARGIPLAIEKKDPRYLVWSKYALDVRTVEAAMMKRLNQPRNWEEALKFKKWYEKQPETKKKEFVEQYEVDYKERFRQKFANIRSRLRGGRAYFRQRIRVMEAKERSGEITKKERDKKIKELSKERMEFEKAMK